MKHKSQEQAVKAFFDQIAPSYPDKLSQKRAFLHHFFSRRIQKACAGSDFNHQVILDVGAGTGILYDHLKLQYHAFDYWACDISAQMLTLSNIPENRRWVGEIHANEKIQKHSLDYIFMLGLTTYLTPTQLNTHIAYISQLSAENGLLIASFTNKSSFENTIRRWIKSLIGFTQIAQHKVIGAQFKTYAYTVKEILNQWNPPDVKVQYIIPAFPFLHHFFPRTAVKISLYLERYSKQWFYPYLCNEFIIFSPAKDHRL